jgi:RimJ/RimL family protein N-acetyltransferase
VAPVSGLNIPARIHLQSERFLLRTLLPEDASERWASWSADHDAMAQLNLPPRPTTLAALRRYIAGFDGWTAILIGIFERASGQHVGQYAVRIDHAARLLNSSLLIGEAAWRGRHVLTEVRVPFNDFFFDVVGIEKMSSTVLAGNTVMLDKLQRGGWTLEGRLRQHARSPADGTRIDLCQLGLLRAEWHAWKARQAQGAPGEPA